MKKRMVCLLMAAVFVLGLAPANAFAAEVVDSGSCGDDVTYTLYDDGLLTISGTGKMKDHVYNGYKYTVPWYRSRESVNSVVIADGVTGIGDYTFVGCSGLTSVSIPDSVTGIGDGAFQNCTSLTGITIPDSVTGIGEWTFYGCSNLTDITIPEGVASIERYTFARCTSLAGITIPDSVTSIGERAFEVCTSLTGITIPDSVASIGEWAFSGCAGLTGVTIPNGVAGIGRATFLDCSSLISVTIPNSVTSIGYAAFRRCTSLTGVTIPNSVTSIEEWAFDGCTSLTRAAIPNSVTSIGNSAFYCYRLKDVYFTGTEEEWKAIDIVSGIPSTAVIHYNSNGLIPSEAVPVPSGQYCIHVVDQDGRPVSGATVTGQYVVNRYEAITGSDGNAQFPLYLQESPKITASKSGCLTWSNENSNWKKNENRYETVVLYPESAGGYKLCFAGYSGSPSMSDPVDLLTRTKKLNLKNDGNLIGDLTSGKFYVSCASNESAGVARYELWQKDKKITESDTGSFGELSVTSFSKGGGCFVRVVTSDGKQVDTNINLEFAENKTISESLGNGLSVLRGRANVSFPSDVPFVGGSTFSVENLPALPVEVKILDEKIYLGINAKIWESGGNTDSETKGLFDEFKKDLKDGKGPLNALRKMDTVVEVPGKTLSGSPKVSISIVGYAEANYGSSTATGELYFLCAAKTPTLYFNTVVVIVPVTVHISGSAKLKAEGKFLYNWEDDALNAEFPLSLTVGLDAFGGVGADRIIGVGAYGSANVKLGMELCVHPFLKNIDLTGELGAKAYLGSFEWSRAFAHQTWHLYTANSVGAMSLMGEDEPWTAGLTDASRYAPADLSYLSRESGWQGGGLQLMDAEASTRLTPLLTDTYRNARPVMLAAGDALCAAFVRADQAGGDRYVVVTRYNGSAWSEPVRIDANAVLDDSPVLCADGSGSVWLAYARTTDGWTDKTSLADYARNQEIVVGRLDAETMTLTGARTYAPETGYVHSQTLSVVDGTPVLAWADTEVTDENSILAPETGSIRYAVCSGGVWGDAATLTGAVPEQLAVGEYRGQTAVAYTKDGTLSCVTANGTVMDLADDVTGRVTYGTLPGAVSPAFLWNGENTLNASDGTAVAAEGITKEYAIVGDGVYYSAADEDSANLMFLPYQNNAWGLPIQITGDARYLENLSAAGLNGQDYVFGMSTAVTISEETVEDAKNLVWSQVMPVSDLRLEDASYDVKNAAAGTKTAVTLAVTNAGDHTVTGFDIFVDNSKIQTGACSLAPGESMDTEITITCPGELTSYTVEVVETGKDDYHPDDNFQTVTMGYADAVVDLEYHQIGARKALVATVTNEGISPASGSLLFCGRNGDVVAESTFEDLTCGDAAVARYEFAADAANIIDGDVSVMAVVDQEEYDTFNNEASLFVSKPDQPTAIQAVTISGQSVTGDIFCSGEDIGAMACCAFYNDQGRMLETKTAAVTADQKNTLSYPLPDGTKTVKWFVLDEDGSPLCESAEKPA